MQIRGRMNSNFGRFRPSGRMNTGSNPPRRIRRAPDVQSPPPTKKARILDPVQKSLNELEYVCKSIKDYNDQLQKMGKQCEFQLTLNINQRNLYSKVK